MIDRMPGYIIISPVKDEEQYVALTLGSVTQQTAAPLQWIIVDDGSKDKTASIVDEYAQDHQFIKLVTGGTTRARRPGVGVIEAFERGRAVVADADYDFIVKLDCDLSFPPDYFEKLLARFQADPTLGIASGVYSELDRKGRWVPVQMPAYHAFGACKVVRRQCYEEIGGFVAAKGWDTVDEIRAMSLGWKTAHFTELETRHHKPEGTGIGVMNTSRMHGEIYYVTGGGPLFLLFKSLRRAAASPYLMGAVALVAGYLGAAIRRTPKLVTKTEARCYRALLRKRLWRWMERPQPVTLGRSVR